LVNLRHWLKSLRTMARSRRRIPYKRASWQLAGTLPFQPSAKNQYHATDTMQVNPFGIPACLASKCCGHNITWCSHLFSNAHSAGEVRTYDIFIIGHTVFIALLVCRSTISECINCGIGSRLFGLIFCGTFQEIYCWA
jgi:hypothetical protein